MNATARNFATIDFGMISPLWFPYGDSAVHLWHIMTTDLPSVVTINPRPYV